MSKSLALFDFDGTLTHRDSLLDFILYSCGWRKTIVGAVKLSPVLVRYKLGYMKNDKSKEYVLQYFFGGWTKYAFTEAGNSYANKRLPDILKNEAFSKLQWHLNEGHEVAIVSASLEDWIYAWASSLGINLIATKAEVSGGLLTGKFQSRNCYGTEKVKRVKEQYDLNKYETIFAYGDSNGDKQMLELADKKFYRSF